MPDPGSCRNTTAVTQQVFSLQERAQEVTTLVQTAEERLKILDKCPFEANCMGDALGSLQARTFLTLACLRLRYLFLCSLNECYPRVFPKGVSGVCF